MHLIAVADPGDRIDVNDIKIRNLIRQIRTAADGHAARFELFSLTRIKQRPIPVRLRRVNHHHLFQDLREFAQNPQERTHGAHS